MTTATLQEGQLRIAMRTRRCDAGGRAERALLERYLVTTSGS
jgi:hypothetical protein